ncbi:MULTISPECIES: cytochrome C assembly family protein [unclassified Luteibacter]|jgi:ABC-type uncharacterized transport system permease subunit|uniref:cytochrome C assembly family protein n=1 Tax=unclassified Luteibacter TaxID=2620188 RepID=UPI000563E272|nr:cytochrome c biogenesis protein CcsA [Luteibacter sp. 9135]
MIVTTFSLVAVVLYLSAAGALARPLVTGGQPLARLGASLAAVAALAHGAVLLSAHRGTLDLHFFAALSLVAWIASVLTLLVNLSRPVAGLGIIVFPLAAIFVAVDAFLAPKTAPDSMTWQIELHVTIAVLAFGLLSIAAALAILLAIQERALRRSRFGHWLRALPPLTLTEVLLFRLIAAGFVLLTLTLVTGALFVGDLFGQHLVHKTVLSIVAWVVFGVLLWGRWRHGWRGIRAVYLTLAGMGILLLAFFGTKAVLELVLHRVA